MPEATPKPREAGPSSPWLVLIADDAASMRRLLDLGVNGIMTDRTDVLRDVLQSRGEWEEPR